MLLFSNVEEHILLVFRMFTPSTVHVNNVMLSLQKAAKRDATLEAQAREWMEDVVGEPYPPGSYEEAIKDGIYLCK